MTRDEYFLGIAKAVALGADCRHRQIGAVVVDEEKRVISTGVNRALEWQLGCQAGGCPRGLQPYSEDIVLGQGYEEGSPGYCVAIHAEVDAILNNGRYTNQGCTLYVTAAPCDTCTRIAWSAGITEIITPAEVIHPHGKYARTVT